MTRGIPLYAGPMAKSPCSKRRQPLGPVPDYIALDRDATRWASVLNIHLAVAYFDPLLGVLGKTIRETAATIESAETTQDVDLEYIEGSGCELVENLLGVAFVVCQRFIGDVERLAIKVLKAKGADDALWDRKRLRQRGPTLPSGLSQVLVLDAAANLYKHGSKWAAWKTAKKPEDDPNVLLALGISEDAVGEQLRDVSEALGNTDYHDTAVFTHILTVWGKEMEDYVWSVPQSSSGERK